MAKNLKGCKVYQSLTPKRKLFCLEYLKDFNASRAARDAKFSIKTAGSMGDLLLKNIEIQVALKEIQSVSGNSEGKAIASLEEIQEYWTMILRGEMGKVCSWNDGGLSFNSTSDNMPVESRRLIKKISVKEKTSPAGDFTEVQTSVELHDPLKASEMLTRSLGGFIDKTEITVIDKPLSEMSDEELLDLRERIGNSKH